MLDDEKLVDYMYNNRNAALMMEVDSTNNTILRAELFFTKSSRQKANPSDMYQLLRLNILLNVLNKEYPNNKRILGYRLSARAISMLDTVKQYKVLKLHNTDNLDFLDLAKLAVILSHVGKGMVDFQFNESFYTVRMITDYSFFEEQYKLAKELGKL
jgi:hypothetical protein